MALARRHRATVLFPPSPPPPSFSARLDPPPSLTSPSPLTIRLRHPVRFFSSSSLSTSPASLASRRRLFCSLVASSPPLPSASRDIALHGRPRHLRPAAHGTAIVSLDACFPEPPLSLIAESSRRSPARKNQVTELSFRFASYAFVRSHHSQHVHPPSSFPDLAGNMSTAQDIMSANGNDIVDSMDQLKIDERLGPDGEPAPKTDEEYAQAQLTLRAIVSSKEAGVIIGKGGKNVADLRDETGVKAGVSKVVQGVHDRVLTITGECDAISRAYAIVARALLEGAPAMGMGGIVQSNGTHPIKLLISHNQMGTIIGRQGLKIKHIQDVSGVRMVAQKEMLPQSTERIVEVQGTPEGIQRAVWEICKCLVDDWQRGTGTVLYNPVVRTQPGASGAVGGTGYSSSRGEYGSPRVMRTGNGADFSNGGVRPFNRRSDSDAASRGPPTHDENGEEIQTQNISIPADMVGCIIGRAGSKISEIRKTSGARISIAKAPHDETGERMFTIMGTAKANESALFLLYENLEAEKMRRSQIQDQE
ncbi:RNA-binding protein rnc1 [Tolypocladium ophioglossoides CBS 100239]|uniref:RNA-binding protein rnc1 n=1 Tax=Tolypocladium ophioglossoides (strain CBS 100239) TaxID=1163406 RepID=A0A0L0NM27_TOLOC|nr:RNA-binding protein rnc1 [Tolypocladium ophioglossoides CBS 100239]